MHGDSDSARLVSSSVTGHGPSRRRRDRNARQGCQPGGGRFEFVPGRQFSRLRNSVARVVDAGPGALSCRGPFARVVAEVCDGDGVGGFSVPRGFGSLPWQTVWFSRFGCGTLCLSVLSGEVVNDPVRLAPRGERFSNSASAVNAVTIRLATLEPSGRWLWGFPSPGRSGCYKMG